MARVQDDDIGFASFIADSDLSGSANLYRFVRASSTYGNAQISTGGSNPGPVGVLQETASAGQAVSVKTVGHTLLIGQNAGCNLLIGNLIVSASNGTAQSASAVGDVDGLSWGRWLGPNITSGSAVGEALLFGSGASILARS